MHSIYLCRRPNPATQNAGVRQRSALCSRRASALVNRPATKFVQRPELRDRLFSQLARVRSTTFITLCIKTTFNPDLLSNGEPTAAPHQGRPHFGRFSIFKAGTRLKLGDIVRDAHRVDGSRMRGNRRVRVFAPMGVPFLSRATRIDA